MTIATAASRGLRLHQSCKQHGEKFKLTQCPFLNLLDLKFPGRELGLVRNSPDPQHSLHKRVSSSAQRHTAVLDRHTNVSLQWSLRRFTETPKAISCSVPRRCSFHAFYRFSMSQSSACKGIIDCKICAVLQPRRSQAASQNSKVEPRNAIQCCKPMSTAQGLRNITRLSKRNVTSVFSISLTYYI